MVEADPGLPRSSSWQAPSSPEAPALPAPPLTSSFKAPRLRTAKPGRRPSLNFLAANWTADRGGGGDRPVSPSPAAVSGVEEVLYTSPARPPEEFDDEILDFAFHLGIDPEREPHLLPIAEEAFNAPVFEPWTEVEDGRGRIFYYNPDTDVSQWEHPRDKHYRAWVFKLKSESALKNRPFTGAAPAKPRPPPPPVPAIAVEPQVWTAAEGEAATSRAGGPEAAGEAVEEVRGQQFETPRADP